jgi:endonuclease/exonuclease/phosphatase family metal-dependent hydrolase
MMRQSQLVTAVAVVVVLEFAFMPHSVSAGRHEKKEVEEVEIANLNLLHGVDCDPAFDPDFPDVDEGDQCRLADRVELLFEHLVDIGCPDIVTLQEIVNRDFVPRRLPDGTVEMVGPLDSSLTLIEKQVQLQAQACGFQYHLLYLPVPVTVFEGTDEELILSRYPILKAESRLLHSALFPPDIEPLQFFARHVLFARIDHPIGPVDVFTTHLSSDADFGDNDCNSTVDFGDGVVIFVPCPEECKGLPTVRACQAQQLALFVEERHDVQTPAYVSGDMNADPNSDEDAIFVERGWIDTYLAAGNSECDPMTGLGCTSGRDEVRGELEDPALNVHQRIDYVFVVPGDSDLNCCLVQTQMRHSGLFAAEPNPFVDECGPAPLPICWASDHSGNFGNIRCPKNWMTRMIHLDLRTANAGDVHAH